MNQNFDDVMKQIGFGRVHLLAMLTNGLLQMMAILETMGMSIIAPASQCDLNLNTTQISTVTAASFLGIICSSYFWGYITDKLGRRWVLLHTISLVNVFSVISMFMYSFTSFFIMRFLTGIFVAGPSFIAMTYLSEFCTRQTMAKIVAFTFIFNGFGMLYPPSMGTLIFKITKADWEYQLIGSLTFRPWRLLGCTYIVPGVIAFLLLLILPESPQFLFMVGEEDKAIAAMNWICRKNTGKQLSDEQLEQMRLLQHSTVVGRERRRNNPLKVMMDDAMPLFRKPFAEYFICSCIVMFSLGLVANGLGLWFTDLRNRKSHIDLFAENPTVCEALLGTCEHEQPLYLYDPMDNTVCNDGFHGFRDSLILGVTYIVAYQMCALSLHIMSRKLLFVGALLTSSTCGFCLIVLIDKHFQLMCFVLFLALPGVVNNLLGGAILGFIPTYLRAKALCICLMWSRLGAIVGTSIVGNFLAVNCELTFMSIALFPLLSASIESFLPL